MSREYTLDDVVTEFLLNTCRLRGLPTVHAVQAALFSSVLLTKQPGDDYDGQLIRLITGSGAEFYIEPMLPHIGDIDVMYHRNTELAIPRGHPPPTKLPAEFHNYVKVFEIIDSHFPGYVFLEARYLLTECSDGGNYNAVEYDRDQYFTNHLSDPMNEPCVVHGPALLSEIKKHVAS